MLAFPRALAARPASLLLVLAAGLAACTATPPVAVVPRDQLSGHRELEVCALHGNVPSERSSWALRMLEVEQEYERDPLATLKFLHDYALEEPNLNALFVLAELSYLAGKRLDNRDCFLTAAIYAYLFLLPEDPAAAPSPYDRRFRWACDIYNRSLARAFAAEDGKQLRLAPETRELATGSLRIEVDYAGFPFGTHGLELLSTDVLDLRGLSLRVRDSGLGAPVIAVTGRRGEGTAGVGIQDRTSVAATVFLRLRGTLPDLEHGLEAVLELHSAYDARSLAVTGHSVPLESDPSATVAYGIESANLWRLDLTGFFKGSDASQLNGLILPRPFQPGRIPVVLVHGTASNPAYWAELINTLSVDPEIRARYQFWFFLYATGNPIVYSAATLRRALAELLAQHDPAGADPAMKRMVIVGHSQGGLLARLMGSHLDVEDVSRAMLGAPLEELDLDAQQAALMRECFDIEPEPHVERLVFVATPHRGSFQAARWFSRLFAKMIAVPGELVGLTRQITREVAPEKLPPALRKRVPTSLDNMDPDSPILRYLEHVPIDPRIRAHSIIAIGDAEEPAGADDGVVEYESAHLEGVESEVLVPSKHSCQSHPRTIIELRRILREHLEQVTPR